LLPGPESIAIDALAAEVAAIPRRASTLLIGIDGPGAAGKSVFAVALASALRGNAAIVAMDDFFRPSAERLPGDPRDKPIGADFDWQRMRDQVLRPLTSESVAHYQRYAWESDQLEEWCEVTPGGIVIVEGVYSTRSELAAFYDHRVWVECPRAIRVARGIARDGAASREVWEHDWMIAEDMYIAAQAPQDRADVVIDGSGEEGMRDHRRQVMLCRRASDTGQRPEEDRSREFKA
jgi:uridine kinase